MGVIFSRFNIIVNVIKDFSLLSNQHTYILNHKLKKSKIILKTYIRQVVQLHYVFF